MELNLEPLTIKAMKPTDWPAVRGIYEQGLATGNATFQTVAPSWADWDEAHLAEPRLIAERDGLILGWAVLAAISSRPVYRGVAEVSVYVGADARGQGVGLALMQALTTASEQQGLWTLTAGVFPENTGSLALIAAPVSASSASASASVSYWASGGMWSYWNGVAAWSVLRCPYTMTAN